MKKIILNENMVLPKTAVILGNFDGIHKGHMLLIHKAKKISRQEALKTAVFTFFPHPSYVLNGKQPVDLIFTNIEKERVMEAEGLDFYIELPFTKASSETSPKQFIEDIILKRMNARAVIIGSDYRFGKDKVGDYKLLVEYSEEYDFDVFVIHKLKYNDKTISSTWIREEIKKGNLELAQDLMGREFFIHGVVEHGKQIGTQIGFPTANIIPDQTKLLPPNGVYVAEVLLQGKVFKGITNIGNKPTVDGNALTVETHIIDFDENIYGEEIIVSLHHFIREERKFKSLMELKEQIAEDIEYTKKYNK